MAEKPEAFDCEVVGWGEVHKTVGSATDDVIESNFNPTAIVGIARGGWVPARQVADFLEKDNLTSMKIDHYQGTSKTKNAEVQFNTRPDAIDGEKVLLVDDIVDTGETVLEAIEDIEQGGAEEARSLTIHSLPSSNIQPDYIGEKYGSFRWVVYPWNVVEDMNELIKNVVMDEQVSVETVKSRLEEYNGVTDDELSKLNYTVEEFVEILDKRDQLEYDGDELEVV
mgnify:CR=1 FL=1